MGLTQRYAAVRRVEMGFVNYYTASTGRTKDPRTCEEEAALEARRRGKEVREQEKLVRALEKEKEKAERRREKRERERKDKEITSDQDTELGNETEHDPPQGHEKQELARLRREEARMEAESLRMNGVPESRSPTPSLPDYTQSADDGDRRERHDEDTQEQHDGDEQQHEGEHHDEPYTEPPKKRERRFCILPRDAEQSSWIKVPMAGVDEVGAHCGLFAPGPVYERLVGDVAGRLEAWVGEEVSRRVAELLM